MPSLLLKLGWTQFELNSCCITHCSLLHMTHRNSRLAKRWTELLTQKLHAFIPQPWSLVSLPQELKRRFQAQVVPESIGYAKRHMVALRRIWKMKAYVCNSLLNHIWGGGTNVPNWAKSDKTSFCGRHHL